MAQEAVDTQSVVVAHDPVVSEHTQSSDLAISPPETVAHTAVPSHLPQEPGMLDVSGPMMLITAISFGILAFILYKIAWKPILKGLDEREASIRKSLDDAEKARAELMAVEARTRQMMAEARAEGESIISAARKSAVELANAVEKRAQEKTVAMTEEARREIVAATESARIYLRAESADLAIMLAGKIVGEGMDSEKNRTLMRNLVSKD